MKRSIVLVLLVLAISAPVFAQEVDTPTPEVTETLAPTITPTPVIVEPPPPNEIPPDEPGELPVTTPETLLGQLFSLLKDSTYMIWAGAGVVVFVGLFKIVAGAVGWNITGNTAVVVTLVVQVIVWLGYAISNYAGQGEAFRAGYLVVVDIARSILPLAGAIFTGHVIYQQSAKRSVPVLGYYPKPKNEAPKMPIVS